MNGLKMIELLSPAGSVESLEAAVRSGADAVYFGLPEFNARRNATNFTHKEFASAVDYCSRRGVKTDITFNILISDGEIEKAEQAIRFIADCGADAVIVQDLGVSQIIREACPSLKLHASTQMTVHSPGAIYKLKELGFSRAVLARELSEKEITDIIDTANKVGMETEVFVHGAHCMCVSGQCYFSGMIGQRSGNRGLCAQPCRLEYGGEYPLSMKDMSLINHVEKLSQIGVTSIKIEGRMKRPEYVAAATRAYYNAIRGIRDDKLNRNLSKVFSRSGHTDGYFTGNMGPDMFGIRSKDDVISTSSILNELHSIYRGEMQRVKVDISFSAKQGKPVVLNISDGEHEANAVSAAPQKSIQKELTGQSAEISLSKLGGTPFVKNHFTCDIDRGVFISDKDLNAMRRSAVEKLLEMRKAVRKECVFSDKRPSPRRSSGTRLFARFPDSKSVPGDLSGVDRIYVPLFDDLPDAECDMGVEIPRLIFCPEDRVARRLENAAKSGAKYALCHNLAAVKLAQDAGLRVHAGFGMNVFNSYSETALEDAEDITLSFELKLSEAGKVSRGGIIVYGRLPLMITRNCPKSGGRRCSSCDRTLTDRKGYVFPIVCGKYYSEILNSKPLCITENIDGFDFNELYFTNEPPEKVSEILNCYKNGIKIKGDYTRGLYYRGVI